MSCNPTPGGRLRARPAKLDSGDPGPGQGAPRAFSGHLSPSVVTGRHPDQLPLLLRGGSPPLAACVDHHSPVSPPSTAGSGRRFFLRQLELLYRIHS